MYFLITRVGDSQSPRPVSFGRLLRHAENTLVLFFVICPTPQGINDYRHTEVMEE